MLKETDTITFASSFAPQHPAVACEHLQNAVQRRITA